MQYSGISLAKLVTCTIITVSKGNGVPQMVITNPCSQNSKIVGSHISLGTALMILPIREWQRREQRWTQPQQQIKPPPWKQQQQRLLPDLSTLRTEIERWWMGNKPVLSGTFDIDWRRFAAFSNCIWQTLTLPIFKLYLTDNCVWQNCIWQTLTEDVPELFEHPPGLKETPRHI